MQVVKLYAWESPFKIKINTQRSLEISQVIVASIYRALNESLSFCSNTLIAVLPFLAFFWLGGVFTPSRIFGSVAIIGNLKLSLTKWFAQAVNFGSDALVSIKRVQEFLLLEQVVEMDELIHDDQDCLLVVDDATFSWPNIAFGKSNVDLHQKESMKLENVSLTLKRGLVIGVCGTVGTGKSSLSNALIGEMECIKGSIAKRYTTNNRPVKVAYCSQIPWIVSATIKENITFGSEFNQDWFDIVIDSCELASDIATFEDGIETVIGERGGIIL